MLIKVGSLLIFFFMDAAKFSPSVLERGGAGMLDWKTHMVQPDLMAAFEHSLLRGKKKQNRPNFHGIIKAIQSQKSSVQ